MRTGLPIIIAMAIVLVLGLYIPQPLDKMIRDAAAMLEVGSERKIDHYVRRKTLLSTEVGRVRLSPLPKFRETVLDGVANGMRVAALFGESEESGRQVRLFVVLADSAHGQLHVAQTRSEGRSF